VTFLPELKIVKFLPELKIVWNTKLIENIEEKIPREVITMSQIIILRNFTPSTHLADPLPNPSNIPRTIYNILWAPQHTPLTSLRSLEKWCWENIDLEII
jgi:hypothetical protein